MNRENTCCVTGHRKLPETKIRQIAINLNREIEQLLSVGVEYFISGGALGFDLIAAENVILKRDKGYSARLIFALPCRDHDKKWTGDQKNLLHGLIHKADKVLYISREYDQECMRLRNQYMVEHSKYCICAFLRNRSGTGQTLAMAKRNHLNILNIAKP